MSKRPRCHYRGCRRLARTIWRACGERVRLCWIHDVELHELVLMFIGDHRARRKSARYAAQWIRKVNATIPARRAG